METPEAIVVAICVLVFVMVMLCSCMLKSSLLNRLQTRLGIPTDRTDLKLGQTDTVTLQTEKTVLSDSM